MIKVECQEFIAIEKVGPVIIAFSNKPCCEFAFSTDEGIHWAAGKATAADIAPPSSVGPAPAGRAGTVEP